MKAKTFLFLLILCLAGLIWWQWKAGAFSVPYSESARETAAAITPGTTEIAETAETVTGTIRVTVLDGVTELPLPGAAVVIPELGKHFLANAQGVTEKIEVAAARDMRFDGIQKKDWGEVTLLIYCDGYIPFALFYTQVCENADRNGPTVYLFPEDGSMEGQSFTVVESPEEEWAKALIQANQP